MNFQMISSDSTIVGSGSNDRMKTPDEEDGPESGNKEGMAAFDLISEGIRMSSSGASSQEDNLMQLIQYGLDFEYKCIEGLSTATIEELNHDGGIGLIDDIQRKTAAFDSKAMKAQWSHSNNENALNRSHGESKKEVIKNESRNNNKENTTANGQQEKLLIRLPFVNWKTTLSKAMAVYVNKTYCDDENHGDMLDRMWVGRLVSKIVEGWLLVLARLDHADAPTFHNNEKCKNPSSRITRDVSASGGDKSALCSTKSRLGELRKELSSSSASLSFSSIEFSSATSYRSQIYRRLMLLLLGFVDSIDPSQTRQVDSCLTDKENMGMTMASTNVIRIVEHTRELARKILKEEGSTMKKKKYLLHRINSTNSLFDPSPLPTFDSRRIVAVDGIYYYCCFTAIAAECGEYLGDIDTALLAYKSIRAMEDRQRQNDASRTGNRSNMLVYNCGNQAEEGIGTEIGLEGYAGEECISRKISTDFIDAGHANISPRISITKTPANTPKAVSNKSYSNIDDRSLVAMTSTKHHASANRPFAIQRSAKTLFSSIISSPRVSRALSPPNDSEFIRYENMRNRKRSSIDSKIGNDFVPSGTLEERIQRCSS